MERRLEAQHSMIESMHRQLIGKQSDYEVVTGSAGAIFPLFYVTV
jgi:hypothetical protein